MSQDLGLGVNYPCYGKYKCTVCKTVWTSVNAWKYFGQKCAQKDCHSLMLTKPENLSEVFYYICKYCPQVWKSKFMEKGMKCRNEKCEKLLMPVAEVDYSYETARINNVQLQMKEEGTGVHMSSLCEKCVLFEKTGIRRCSRAKTPRLPRSNISVATNLPPVCHIHQFNHSDASITVPLETNQLNKPAPESSSIYTNQTVRTFQVDKQLTMASLTSEQENIEYPKGLEYQPRMTEASFVQAEPSCQARVPLMAQRPTAHQLPCHRIIINGHHNPPAKRIGN